MVGLEKAESSRVGVLTVESSGRQMGIRDEDTGRRGAKIMESKGPGESRKELI